jgi:hypothetical protein
VLLLDLFVGKIVSDRDLHDRRLGRRADEPRPFRTCRIRSVVAGKILRLHLLPRWTVKKLTLHGQELKIGWGKPSTVPSQVVQAIALAKATRNVYLGGLDDSLTESELRDDLCRFGPIDQVKIVRDKGIGFVHFLSIGAAMKVDIRDFEVISSNAFC